MILLPYHRVARTFFQSVPVTSLAWGRSITDTGTTWGPTPLELELGFNDASGIGGTQVPTALSPNNGTFSFGTSVANNSDGWVQYSVSAVAPPGSEYAAVFAMFMDNGQVSTENTYFDNAVLEGPRGQIPEPSNLALLLLGFGVPLFFIRRHED